jgi:hypothetical protein
LCGNLDWGSSQCKHFLQNVVLDKIMKN